MTKPELHRVYWLSRRIGAEEEVPKHVVDILLQKSLRLGYYEYPVPTQVVTWKPVLPTIPLARVYRTFLRYLVNKNRIVRHDVWYRYSNFCFTYAKRHGLPNPEFDTDSVYLCEVFEDRGGDVVNYELCGYVYVRESLFNHLSETTKNGWTSPYIDLLTPIVNESDEAEHVEEEARKLRLVKD